MNFCLHVGNAIEGAIGSQFKIDATYLSYDIALSNFVRTQNDFYSLPILLTDHFQKILSSEAQSRTRQIDELLITNTGENLKLHTFDINTTLLI